MIRGWVRAMPVALAAVGLALSPIQQSQAATQCLPGMCGFSESGKKGPFLKGINTRELAKNDKLLNDGSKSEGLLAAQSINRGQLFGAGLAMPQTETQLEAMVAKFAQFWPYRAVGPIRVRIVGSNSFVPEAFADNVIVVPFGVIARAKTDAQVAWLMAHEFSHIALAHFAREARGKARARAIDKTVSVIDMVTAASQVRVASTGNQVRVYEVQDKDAIAAGNAAWARGEQLKRVLLLSGAFFSRKDEDKADVAGLDLIIASGYSESGGIDALEVIANDELGTKSLFSDIMTATADYAKKSGSAALASVNRSSNLEAIANNWFKDMAENLLVTGLGKLENAYLSKHRPPGKRIAGLRDYYKNAYKGAEGAPLSRAWLGGVQATEEFRQAKIAVDAYTVALDSLRAGNPVKARADLQPALATRYSSTPLIGNLQAKIAVANNDLRGGDAAYSRVERLALVAPVRAAPRAPARGRRPTVRVAPPSTTPPPPVSRDSYLEQNLEGFLEHVQLLVRMRSYDKALAVIAESKKRFGDDQAFLPDFIAIYAATRNNEAWASAIVRCGEVADPAIEQRCQGAMLSEAQQKKMEEMSPADRQRIESALARASSKPKGGGFLRQLIASRDDNDED